MCARIDFLIPAATECPNARCAIMLPRFVVILLLACALGGCGSALADAMDSFNEARYPTAAARFRAFEPEIRTLNAHERARYSLYRGLTHLALGDARAACFWLGYAKVRADREPHVFDVSDRSALLSAWRSMGHMPGDPGFSCTETAQP